MRTRWIAYTLILLAAVASGGCLTTDTYHNWSSNPELRGDFSSPAALQDVYR
jgi:hypothetical protein